MWILAALVTTNCALFGIIYFNIMITPVEKKNLNPTNSLKHTKIQEK